MIIKKKIKVPFKMKNLQIGKRIKKADEKLAICLEYTDIHGLGHILDTNKHPIERLDAIFLFFRIK
jgi:hypothetical protein